MSYHPCSIRDESVLLSMYDQAITDIWVIGDTERSVRDYCPEVTVMVENGFGRLWIFVQAGILHLLLAKKICERSRNDSPRSFLNVVQRSSIWVTRKRKTEFGQHSSRSNNMDDCQTTPLTYRFINLLQFRVRAKCNGCE
jgi:hypothetical protein